ncbi:MAG: N-formylglutamate amidohydrolase [Bacteriovoracaceae bacterium]
MSELIYDIHMAENPKAIICMPHSGMNLPEEFKDLVVSDSKVLGCDVDFRVFDLIDKKKLLSRGICLIIAKNIRTSVDLNRPRSTALLNWDTNTMGEQVVSKRPESELSEELLKKYYDPYFNKVKEIIKDNQIDQGIDLHSMPSRPTNYHLKKNPNQKLERPDFCLSDLEGKSCPKAWMNDAIKYFENKNYKVGYNDPYKGGQGTVFLHEQGLKAMQIEIKREIYMEETSQTLVDSMALDLKEKLTSTLLEIFDLN